jgi:hypothetical protein
VKTNSAAPLSAPQNLHAKQQELLASHVAKFMRPRWFEDHTMSLLLINVYSRSLAGDPLNKVSAWKPLNIDIKTGRKHIARAVELGLIKVSRSNIDKRVQLLEPSDRLKKMIETDLSAHFDDLRRLMHALLEFPLPNTGALSLVRGSSRELDQPETDSGERPRVTDHGVPDEIGFKLWETDRY